MPLMHMSLACRMCKFSSRCNLLSTLVAILVIDDRPHTFLQTLSVSSGQQLCCSELVHCFNFNWLLWQGRNIVVDPSSADSERLNAMIVGMSSRSAGKIVAQLRSASAAEPAQASQAGQQHIRDHRTPVTGVSE